MICVSSDCCQHEGAVKEDGRGSSICGTFSHTITNNLLFCCCLFYIHVVINLPET